MKPFLGPTIYFADAYERPGSVYAFTVGAVGESVFYTRRSGMLGSFAYLGTSEDGKLYFANPVNGKEIYRIDRVHGRWRPPEGVVYTHSTYVRDIAFGPGWEGSPGPRLYFSEATGAGGGKIWRVGFQGRVELFYTVTFPWAGNFAFDKEGNLYLSSGNQVPAHLYRVVNGVPKVIFTHDEPIMGFVVRVGIVYFANRHDRIYGLNLGTGELRVLYESPGHTHISDVGLIEE